MGFEYGPSAPEVVDSLQDNTEDRKESLPASCQCLLECGRSLASGSDSCNARSERGGPLIGITIGVAVPSSGLIPPTVQASPTVNAKEVARLEMG